MNRFPPGFFDAAPDLAEVTFQVPDPAERPAVFDLIRPPVWSAATSPESAFAAQYALAARRAREVLADALGEPFEG